MFLETLKRVYKILGKKRRKQLKKKWNVEMMYLKKKIPSPGKFQKFAKE